MRVSRLYRAPVAPEAERTPITRWLLWFALATGVVLGGVLFFLHGRSAPSLL